MIPHTSAPFPPGRKTLPENTKSPAAESVRSVADGSAELVCHQGGDPSTETFGLFRRFCLREDADDRLRARRTDEYPSRSVELGIDLLDHRDELVGKRVTPRTRQVLHHLREARHDRDRLRQTPSL